MSKGLERAKVTSYWVTRTHAMRAGFRWDISIPEFEAAWGAHWTARKAHCLYLDPISTEAGWVPGNLRVHSRRPVVEARLRELDKYL